MAYAGYFQDGKWIHKNAKMLAEKYPNECLAVRHKKVISHEKTLRECDSVACKLRPKLDYILVSPEDLLHPVMEVEINDFTKE